MKCNDGIFRNVPALPGAFCINAGEEFSHISRGFVKPTIHRVYQPARDQLHLERLGLIYFAVFRDDAKLEPIPSPVLLREGLITQDEFEGKLDHEYPTSIEYSRARKRQKHDKKNYDKGGVNDDFEIKGLKAHNHYD
jgi:isopenicillin N synthase-like dioxygenase